MLTYTFSSEIVVNSQSRVRNSGYELGDFSPHLNLNGPNEGESGFDGITPLNFVLIEFYPNFLQCYLIYFFEIAPFVNEI